MHQKQHLTKWKFSLMNLFLTGSILINATKIELGKPMNITRFKILW